MNWRNLFKSRDSGSTSESDAIASEIDRQNRYEQIKREGFDLDAELERLAAKDNNGEKKR